MKITIKNIRPTDVLAAGWEELTDPRFLDLSINGLVLLNIKISDVHLIESGIEIEAEGP